MTFSQGEILMLLYVKLKLNGTFFFFFNIASLLHSLLNLRPFTKPPGQMEIFQSQLSKPGIAGLLRPGYAFFLAHI